MSGFHCTGAQWVPPSALSSAASFLSLAPCPPPPAAQSAQVWGKPEESWNTAFHAVLGLLRYNAPNSFTMLKYCWGLHQQHSQATPLLEVLRAHEGQTFGVPGGHGVLRINWCWTHARQVPLSLSHLSGLLLLFFQNVLY